jgi:hypothetical protein
MPAVRLAEVVGGAGAAGPAAARRVPTAAADPPRRPHAPDHDRRTTTHEHESAPSPETAHRRYTGVRGIWLNQHWLTRQDSPIGPGVQRMKPLQTRHLAQGRPTSESRSAADLPPGTRWRGWWHAGELPPGTRPRRPGSSPWHTSPVRAVKTEAEAAWQGHRPPGPGAARAAPCRQSPSRPRSLSGDRLRSWLRRPAMTMSRPSSSSAAPS